jgi:GAF domain-containing protein
MPRKESLLISTIVELADSLVDDFDVIDLLTRLSNRCVETFGVDAAGVMLASPGGELQFIASSSESMRLLELLQLQSNEGPCVDCFTTGQAIVNRSLDSSADVWPTFAPKAIDEGFHSVHCLPLRLRGKSVGALNLFRKDQGLLDSEDVALAQGFADIATIAILQHQTIHDAQALNDQLSNALNSRISIEQAKGMISQANGCDMLEAFGRLRSHSRNHNRGLTEVARSIVSGDLAPSEVDLPKPASARTTPRQT